MTIGVMDFVLTLIATSPLPPVTEAIIATAYDTLKALGADVGAPGWLHEDVATDIPFNNLPPAQARAAVMAALSSHRVDIVAQPVENRRKKLLLADMDATLTEQESLDELADFAGLKAQVASVTEAAMRGELEFAPALRARMALLKGLPERCIQGTLARLTLMPGATTLFKTLQGQGVTCHIASGGFRHFTRAIAARLGANSERGNALILLNGVLTGEVAEPILGKEAKLAALTELAQSHGLLLSDTLAVGDGANDLPMLLAAGTGIAYRAKPSVAAAAPHNITYSDLTALLYTQGYRETEILGERCQ